VTLDQCRVLSCPHAVSPGSRNDDDRKAAIRQIVQETMRRRGPIRRLYRRVVSDVIVNSSGDVYEGHGAPPDSSGWFHIKSGDFAQFVTTDANLDGSVFQNPLKFQSTRYRAGVVVRCDGVCFPACVVGVRRSNSGRHLGFGVGAHTCPGSKLGLLEAEVTVDVVFRKFPSLTLAVPPSTLRFAELDSMQTLVSLPVRDGVSRGKPKVD
jgi:cytochrome P450